MAFAKRIPVGGTSLATTTAEAPPLCILLVEDDDACADFVIDAFAESLERVCVTRVVRLQEALQELATIAVDVVLLDLTLPDAFDLLGVNAIRAAAPDLALVVLTGSLDGTLCARVMAAGADDYLQKDHVDTSLLKRSIWYAHGRRDRRPRLDDKLDLDRSMVAGLTVLVVDDNLGNRALAQATLEDEGYEVVLAEEGEGAISAFEQARPQCILLDIQMPGMNGVVACRKIRELPGGADVAIVFVTAQHDAATLDRAMLAGGDDFLTKPYRPSELVVRVQTALRLQRIVRERDELHEITKRQRDDLQQFQLRIRDVNEQLLMGSVLAQDLADEANAARAVADVNEERFRTLVRTSSALVWQATADGRVQVDPESWRKFTGVDAGPGEWGWLEVVHPTDQNRVREAWTEAVAAGGPYTCQHRIRKREGGYAWVLAHAARIATSETVGEWIGMLTDVSDRVRVEEARDRFIGILGHDLRNPLNAILMGVELLGDLTEPHSNVVTRITRSAHRIEAMIRDVLDFARGRLGDGIPVAPRQCDLLRMCDEIVAEMKQAYPARTISFEAAGDLRGEWDPDRVEQVLSNLIGNALTYSEGPIRVTGRDEGDDVMLTIHNQGAPIPAAVLQTLFDPFTRGAQDVDGKQRGSEGLGLGLYIASEIVRAHGGTISVSSVQGEGTTFAIRWPRRVHQGAQARTTITSNRT